MPFMEARVEEGNWIEVDGPDGWEYVEASMPVGEVPEYLNPGKSTGDGKTWAGYEYDGPAIDPPENLKEFLRNKQVWFLRIRDGWGAHLDNTQGCMDQTDWSVFETEQEAWDYIHETYCGEFESFCDRDGCPWGEEE